jgi:hypothetical protein
MPNAITPPNIARPGRTSSGKRVSHSVPASAPTAGAARSAEPPRPDLQDVARIDRQQRGRAAEQHGEQVERQRAEDRRLAPDERDAREHRTQRDRLARGRRAAQRDGAAEHRGNRERDGARAERGRCADAVQQPAERRPENLRGLVGRGGQRGRARQVAARHDGRQQRRHRRRFERARGADERGERIDARRRQPAAGRAEQEHAGSQRLDALTDRRDAPPVVAVGHLPDDERQREHRHELRKPDEAERERAVRERINVPADRDRQDLER